MQHVVIVLGSTGHGKSALGNRMTGQENFGESADPESETKQTISCGGSFLGMPLLFVDTPGLNDSQGMDSEHVVQMVETFKTLPTVNSILVVCNAQNPRISDLLKNMIKLFCHIFHSSNFGSHVGFVFTHSFNIHPDQVTKRKQQNSELLKTVITSTGVQVGEIPVFFVDCKSNRTDEEFQRLKAWISSCPPLDTTLIKAVDPVFEKIEEEEQQVIARTTRTPIIENQPRSYSVQVPHQVWDGDLGKIFGRKKMVYRTENRTTTEQVQTGVSVETFYQLQKRKKKTTYGGRVVEEPWEIVKEWSQTVRE